MAWLHRRKEKSMSTETNTKALPAYRIYSVSRNGAKKTVWQEIGAAWKHKDGKGLSLNLAARPLADAQIVLREPKVRKGGAR
jgi:hypothetical protein